MKNALRVMRLIAALTDTKAQTQVKAQSRISPVLRLLVCLETILLSSLSGNAFFSVSIIAVLLLLTAMLQGEQIRRMAGRIVLPVLLTALLMLPAVFLGSPRSLLTVTMKVFTAMLCLALLNEHVPWQALTGALSALHAPDLFVMTLDTTVRFFVLLGRYAARMSEAVSLRRVGTKTWKNAGTGGILGTTWLKSQRMLQANTEAMTCRCFNGTYKKRILQRDGDASERRLRLAANLAYALLVPFLVLFFVVSERAL